MLAISGASDGFRLAEHVPLQRHARLAYPLHEPAFSTAPAG